MNTSNRYLKSIAAASVLFSLSTLFAEEPSTQFKLLDQSSEWTTTKLFWDNRGELLPQPERWDTPHDFVNGELKIRLEIKDKPSDIPIHAMFCFWQDEDECCTRRARPEIIRFSEPGIYYGSFPAPSDGDNETGNDLWSQAKGDSFFHPDQQVSRVQLQWWVHNAEGEWKVLRERGWKGKDPQEDFGVGVKEHIPIPYRVELYIVAKDADFSPPAHWK